MQIKRYKLGDAVSTATQAVGASIHLARGETAISLLPPDTKFALVVEAIEKDFNESFVETDFNLLTMGAQISNQGVVGRFMGYLALSDNKLRFYKALDEDVTQQPDSQANVVSQQQSPLLVYEMDISAVTAQSQSGSYALTDGAKKFLIVNIWKIYGTEGHFDSKMGGLQGGLKPLFTYINSRGGKVKFSNANNIFAIIVIIIMIAMFAFLFLAKKH